MAKVLIVEDEKAMNDLIAIKFRVEGFEVDQAENLAQAKEKATTAGPFDAILSDYLMPDGELFDFLAVLQADPKLKTIPVVVMTNYIEDISVEKLKTMGVVEVITKYQVVPAQMVEKIRQLVGNKVAPDSGAPASPPQG